jgi:hypothetical protein
MGEDCTQFFLRYREVARLVWNLGFWPDPELREVACVLAYEEAMARLFEGMVLLRVGYGNRVQAWSHGLGEPVKFMIAVNSAYAELHVDSNLPQDASHIWGDPVVRLGLGSADLRFASFFDWYQLAPRDFRWLCVLIERLDERPDLVGHLALIELEKCTIWLAEEDELADSAEPKLSGS